MKYSDISFEGPGRGLACAAWCVALLLAPGAVAAGHAAEGGSAAVEGVITVVPAAGGKAAVQDVRELPPLPPWQPGDPIVERPPRAGHGGTTTVPEAEAVEPQAQVERGPHLPANFTKK